MTPKPTVQRIDPTARRSNAPSCRGGASSMLRLSRPMQSPNAPRQPNWLQRALAHFGTEDKRLQTGFGVSQFGVGSTG
jgi:hypothetical protein